MGRQRTGGLLGRLRRARGATATSSDRTPEPPPIEAEEITLHGHRIVLRRTGSGPVLLLVHGITSKGETWRRVMPRLAERFTVIAPDLLGHGESAKPRGDYSLGAYASGIRDILLALGHERATFVGHSLGGGVTLQLSYQFPELCERLVLVDSGGLGREVNPLLRAASLGGTKTVLPFLCSRRVLDAGRSVGEMLDRHGIDLSTDVREMARGHASLADPDARAAFLHTLRTIIEPGGQRVSASDRLYLAENIPVLIVWGKHDRIIPVSHATAAHEEVPHSRLEIFPRSGHFPQLDEPDRFVAVLNSFIDATSPAQLDSDRIRQILQDADANQTDPQPVQPAAPTAPDQTSRQA
jgi:pimeloyl-ACP methyl ester carboxylesterase